MKVFLLTILFAMPSAFAAEVNLNGGDIITIQPNVTTKVSCGGTGSSSDCSGVKASFDKSMEFCFKSEGGGTCARKLWPKFKAANPSCAYAGTETCLNYCFKSEGGGACADICI